MAVRKAVVEACTLVMSAGKVPSTLGPAVSLLPVLFLVLVLCCLVLGWVWSSATWIVTLAFSLLA